MSSIPASDVLTLCQLTFIADFARVLVARAYSTSTIWVIPSMTCGIPFTGSGMKQNAT